jgi:uncharacterized membrane protein YtjA (UPF0391 family)
MREAYGIELSHVLGCMSLSIYGYFSKGEHAMLSWAFVFLIVAVVAAVFGFGGIASAAAGIAKLLFFLFLIVFVVMLALGLMARGRTV